MTPAQETRIQPPSILVVDDDPVVVRILCGVLEQEGFLVHATPSGEQGYAAADELRPDLILLDVNMPGMDGFDACRLLKGSPATAEVPVIFLTAEEDGAHKVRGFDVGAVDYIVKPCSKGELLARVRVHLRLREAQRRFIAAESSVMAGLRELAGIRQAQEGLLVRPSDLPEAGFAVRYRPAFVAGGDFYDVMQTGDRIVDVIIADISGHDMGTSLYTAAFKTAFRNNAGILYGPQDVLRILNGVLRTVLPEDRFVAVACCRINRRTNRATVAVAGQPPPVIVRKAGGEERLDFTGDILGPFETVAVRSETVPFFPGDRIFLYTDGLVDGIRGEVLSRKARIERVQELCAEARELPLHEAVERVAERIEEGGRIDDDLLLLAVEG